MVIWEDSLLLDGVLNAVLDLVRGLLRLEVYQTASVLPVFQQMDDGNSFSSLILILSMIFRNSQQ